MDRTNLNKNAADCLNEIYDTGNLATGVVAGKPTFADGTATVGAAPAATIALGVAVEESGFGRYRTTKFTFTDVTVAVTDEAGVTGWTSLQLYDWPKGWIKLDSAITDLVITKSSTGVGATWDGDIGMGTTICDGTATPMDSTQIDIIPNTTIAQAAAGIAQGDSVSTATENILIDGTTTAKDLFLNVLVDDADQDCTSTPCNFIFNGTVVVNWIFVGDN